MILQSDKYSCGAAALVNALEAVGKHVPLLAVSKLAGTNPLTGTSDAGIRRAVRALGLRPRTLAVVDSRPQAIAALRGHLFVGEPALLSVDRDEHWVAAVGVVGDRFVVVDSADGDLTLILDEAGLVKRWKCPSEQHDVYTAIVITRL